jgi:hypothetical protein
VRIYWETKICRVIESPEATLAKKTPCIGDRIVLDFKEKLPDDCPPEGAVYDALINVCRFLPFSPPKSDKNFQSHAALGKEIGNATECKATSCSLFKFSHIAKQAMKIGAFKNMKVAVLNIPKGAGAHVNGKRGHISFWMEKDFLPVNAVDHWCDCADDVEQAVNDG